jgi:hypothetical protein
VSDRRVDLDDLQPGERILFDLLSTKDAQLTHSLAELARVQRERDEARARLAVVEPVYEAVRAWREQMAKPVGAFNYATEKANDERVCQALRHAIDAALAAEQKEGGSRG